MKRIAIYGAGGFGREMALMIQQINQANQEWDLVGFFDDGVACNEVVEGYRVLGNLQDLNRIDETLHLCVAIAMPDVRSRLVNSITNRKLEYPVLVHPQCLRGSGSNVFEAGSILTAGVILTTNVKVGKFSIVNLASTVGHDVTIGDGCTIMPGCSVSGNVIIGNRTLLGTGSRILQGIQIGEDCLVGAGSVVTKSFDSQKKVMGVPARAI